MTSITTGNLPKVNTIGRDVSFVVTADNVTAQMDLETLAEKLIGNMGVAVIKCSHCGQWGARFCECRKCGAPIE